MKYFDVCIVCQQGKDSHRKKLSEPDWFGMPERAWGLLPSDFIVHLSKKKNSYDSITSWVDRLSQRVDFMKIITTDESIEVADWFFADLCKHHKMVNIIFSDRYCAFWSQFCKCLMKRCDIQLKMSFICHPRKNGASKIVNRLVENYLRFYCLYHEDYCDACHPADVFSYNYAGTEYIGMSPIKMNI